MSSSSTPGFDLRNALDGLRERFTGAPSASAGGRGDSPEDRPGGDIRAAILIELGDEPMHGYQIIHAIETRTGGAWTPSPGQVYPTLQLLVDEALVEAEQVGERKVYTLTDTGRLAAVEAAQTEQPRQQSRQQPAGQPRGRGVQSAVALTRSGVTLGQALAQVAQSGTPEQAERAIAIVDEARRKLYSILAEG